MFFVRVIYFVRCRDGGLVTGAGYKNSNDDGDGDNDGNNDNDDEMGGNSTAAADEERPARVDLRGMGWTICKNPIWKIANDNYGRKGSRARFLVRPGTTYDVLEHRQEREDRPQDPRGFKKDMVLGKFTGTRRDPNSNANKRRRRDDNNNNNYDDRRSGGSRGRYDDRRDGPSDRYTENGMPANMDTALSSGRREGGFTVEELQRERAAKADMQDDDRGD